MTNHIPNSTTESTESTYDANIRKGRALIADLTERIEHGEWLIRERRKLGLPTRDLVTLLETRRKQLAAARLVFRILGESEVQP